MSNSFNPWWEGFDYTYFDDPKVASQIMLASRVKSYAKKAWIVVVIVGSSLSTLFILVQWLLTGSFSAGFSLIFSFLFDIFPVLVFAALSGLLVKAFLNNYSNRFAKIFASRNNLTSFEKVQLPDTGLPLYQEGNRDGIASLLLKTSSEVEAPVLVSSWSYSEGSGKNKKIFQKGLLIVDLPKSLPNMVLQPKKVSGYGMTVYSDKEERGLPAEVDTVFTGYSVAGSEVDFYYIFSPDVLAAAITHAAEFEIHVLNNQIFFITEGFFDYYDIDMWKNLETVVQKVAGQVVEQVARWNESVQQEEVTMPAEETVDVSNFLTSEKGNVDRNMLTVNRSMKRIVPLAFAISAVLYIMFIR